MWWWQLPAGTVRPRRRPWLSIRRSAKDMLLFTARYSNYAIHSPRPVYRRYLPSWGPGRSPLTGSLSPEHGGAVLYRNSTRFFALSQARRSRNGFPSPSPSPWSLISHPRRPLRHGRRSPIRLLFLVSASEDVRSRAWPSASTPSLLACGMKCTCGSGNAQSYAAE